MEIQIPREDDVQFDETSSLLSHRSSVSSVRSNRMQIELEEEYDIVLEDVLGRHWRFLYISFALYLLAIMGMSPLVYNMPLLTMKP